LSRYNVHRKKQVLLFPYLKIFRPQSLQICVGLLPLDCHSVRQKFQWTQLFVQLIPLISDVLQLFWQQMSSHSPWPVNTMLCPSNAKLNAVFWSSSIFFIFCAKIFGTFLTLSLEYCILNSVVVMVRWFYIYFRQRRVLYEKFGNKCVKILKF
jgi:hypothetical protein